MSTWRLIVLCSRVAGLTLLMVILAAIGHDWFAVVRQAPDVGQFVGSALAVFALFYFVLQIFRLLVIAATSQEEGLEPIVRNLESHSLSRRYMATKMLSWVAGDRFGALGAFDVTSTRDRSRCCALWLQWWKHNRNRLRWDAEISRYVEVDLLEEGKDKLLDSEEEGD